MKESVKKRWLKALRSGEYQQGNGYLCQWDGLDYQFCCLGVLYDIEFDGYWTESGDDIYAIDTSAYTLSEEFAEEVGMNNDLCCHLADMNDHGKSFEDIADYIEKNL